MPNLIALVTHGKDHQRLAKSLNFKRDCASRIFSRVSSIAPLRPPGLAHARKPMILDHPRLLNAAESSVSILCEPQIDEG